MGHAQGGIFDVAGFFTEYRSQQPLFRGQFFLTFRRDFADKDIIRPHFRADTDNPLFVKVFYRILAHIGDVTGDLLGSQTGVPGFNLILLNVNGSETIILNQPVGDQDGIFKVAPLPG